MDKVLFVDDEPAVLDGYRRMLHRDFTVQVAVGGEHGLAAIRTNGPFGVIVSDMRMPGMDGAEFLKYARQVAPDSVRMLLTGYTDLNAAIAAVNQGQLFRFLTKPCGKEDLCAALSAGLHQYELLRAEKDLLELTLMGSIKVLSDVLSAANPEIFGRSKRIAGYVGQMVKELELPSPWRFEAAAMLSQLGCVTLDPALIEKAYGGTELPHSDRALFEAHPKAARDLLSHIPRLESIAWMIGQQFAADIQPNLQGVKPRELEELVQGAKVLKLVVAFDNLTCELGTADAAMASLRYRQAEFGPALLAALQHAKPAEQSLELKRISVQALKAGMVLEHEVRNRAGLLIVGKGQELSAAVVMKLQTFAQTGAIDKEVMAWHAA